MHNGLNIIIMYVNLVLNDNVISEKEKLNVKTLKRYFKLKEVESILFRQFQRIYEDGNVSREEAIEKV